MLRAVVARDAPGAPIVDLTHEVPAFDVRAGARVLARSVPHLGPGVVLAVVDPGVGSARRAVALEVDPPAGAPSGGRPRFLVGPDNGLLPWAAAALGDIRAVVRLARPPDAATTFDGRDVFAPVAARLWAGAGLGDVGAAVDPGSLVQLADPQIERGPGRLRAEVLGVDRFGNVELAAVPADAVACGLPSPPGGAAGTVGILAVDAGAGTRPVRTVASFSAVGPGEVGLIADSGGHLALVCDRASAATVLGVEPGAVVTLHRGDRP